MFSVTLPGLKKAPAQTWHFQFSEEIPYLPEQEGNTVPLTAPVHLDLKLTSAGQILWAVGEVKSKVTLVCSRCLKEFEMELTGRFEEKFRLHLKPDRTIAEEMPLAQEEIDFSAHVQETLISSLPMKPLCRNDFVFFPSIVLSCTLSSI